MKIPGKEAYKRKAANAGKPAMNRKKAAVNGSDAKGAYVRKKQPFSVPGSKAAPRQVDRISKSLRARLAGGAD